MQRVPNHQFLYDRGGTLYFRRAVPVEVRAAFGGKREVLVSLKTSNLKEARHLLHRHLAAFDQTLAQATGQADPTLASCPDIPASYASEPTREEMDEAVRVWLARRLETIPVDPDHDDALHQHTGYSMMAENARRSLRLQNPVPDLLVQWTTAAICEEHGWKLSAANEKYLQRVTGRGQVELGRRSANELAGEPRGAWDSTFAPDQYALDLARTAATGSARTKPVSVNDLFAGYVAEANLKPATVKAWKRHLAHLVAFLGHDDASKITGQHIVGWKERLLSEVDATGAARSQRTVNDTYLAGVRAIFRWAKDNQKIGVNPADGVRVRVPKKPKLRERDLTDAEALIILRATLEERSSRITPQMALAYRWVPWLCAYTGSRVNEITQARGSDVKMIDGIWSLEITPEAGTIKTDEARTVPIHSHLIEQGFLEAIRGQTGPLFYNPENHRGGTDGNPQYKKAGERLAKWVREIGVTGDVQPNHGWRHRFKSEAKRFGIPDARADVIQGHAPRTEGERYGSTPLSVLAAEIEKLGRYDTSMGAKATYLPPPAPKAASAPVAAS